jgi:6-phosphogluconate dehydrogenase
MVLTRIGLAVMGQNLALKNILEKGFRISVYNRATSKIGRQLQLHIIMRAIAIYDLSISCTLHKPCDIIFLS